jgi:hypothetical protein
VTAAAGIAASRDKVAVETAPPVHEVPDDWQPMTSMETVPDSSQVNTDRSEDEGSNIAPATIATLRPAALEYRPLVASAFTLASPVPLAHPTIAVARGESGPIEASMDETSAVPGDAADAPAAPEGDPGEGPPPRGAGLIANVLPFDRPALDRAVDRFFAHLEDLDVRQPATLIRVSSTLAVLAAAVALEVARRWYRSRDDASVQGDLLTCGVPEWPGPWPVSPR